MINLYAVNAELPVAALLSLAVYNLLFLAFHEE
jgi:hypothetical protein